MKISSLHNFDPVQSQLSITLHPLMERLLSFNTKWKTPSIPMKQDKLIKFIKFHKLNIYSLNRLHPKNIQKQTLTGGP